MQVQSAPGHNQALIPAICECIVPPTPHYLLPDKCSQPPDRPDSASGSFSATFRIPCELSAYALFRNSHRPIEKQDPEANRENAADSPAVALVAEPVQRMLRGRTKEAEL